MTDMTANGSSAVAEPRREGERGRIKAGLSTKLLALTVLFVMIAEVLIFVPSVSNFRRNWLMERLVQAEIAALATEAWPDKPLAKPLRDQLLEKAQVRSVSLKRAEKRLLLLSDDMPPSVDGHYKITDVSIIELIGNALYVFVAPNDRFIRVMGSPSGDKSTIIDVVIPERPLCDAMVQFAINILILSLIISAITAALVFLAINALMVRPIERLTANMVRFSCRPEDATRVIVPSARTDELGVAERELAAMQRELAAMLHQKSRLAELGLAVSKINHDLRNILATAQLVSDRLGAVQDPTVQRFAPKLIGALDRAIRLCSDTLKHGRAREAPPSRAWLALDDLVAEVADGLALPRPGHIGFVAAVPAHFTVYADRDQLYRVLANIVRNAVEVLEAESAAGDGSNHAVAITARRDGACAVIEIIDTGPGVPEAARAHLFEAFKGSVRKGGSGLGLAISAELIRAHGGTLTLRDEPGRGLVDPVPGFGGVNGRGPGARFEIRLPLPSQNQAREAERPSPRA